MIQLKSDFNIPATTDEINNLEKDLNVFLPTGYKEFLLFSNGAQLCGHCAEFAKIERVAKINKLKKTSNFPEDYITIARIIGDEEILCFSKKTGKFIRCFDGREIIFEEFYSIFKWLVKFIRDSAEVYVDL